MKTRSLKAIVALFICHSPLLALPAHGANAITENITVKGGTIVEDGDDVIITYTRSKILSDGAGLLQFKAGQASADVLAIGGGGSGGRTIQQYNGGAGGGGAGGFVEVFNLLFKGSYAIAVGKGGAGIATKPSVATQGADGGNTTITQNGVQVDGIPVAQGGGGGGAGGLQTSVTGAGRPGGSGGGGSARRDGTSQTSVIAQVRGEGTEGQGHAGGAGNIQYLGGGGGGAGAEGTTPASSTDLPSGGAGRQSQITGNWYAGGGAGGDVRAANKGVGKVDRSAGGGGTGGDSTNDGSRDATADTGSGGGGGNTSKASGAGADGLVVIRLSNYIAGGVTLPTVSSFDYNGNERTAAEATAYYTLGGDVTKTDAGSYTLVVTLTDVGRAIGWDESLGLTTDSVEIPWSIAKKSVPKPVKVQAEDYTYNGTERMGYAAGLDYSLDDRNRQTNAGTYTVTATLNDTDNTEWADGAANPRNDLVWKILQKTVAKPTPTAASFTYTGAEQTGFATGSDYSLDDQNSRTNAGTYAVTATLNDTDNTKWADNAANPRSDLVWTIAAKEVEKPTAVGNLQYTGEEQVGVLEPTVTPPPYALAGHRQTDAGSYTATATLNNPAGVTNYKWKNGDAAPYDIPWSIATRKVAWSPVAETFVYVRGEVRNPIPASDWYEIVGGNGSAEDAGDYSCTVALKGNAAGKTNVEWDSAAGGGVANKDFAWTITPQEVAVPTVISSFVYAESPKGTPVTRVALTIPADADYHRVDGDELTQNQAGEYAFKLALNDEANMIWAGGTNEEKDFDWEIVPAENEIRGLAVDDWQVGDTTPRMPGCTDVKFGPKTLVTYAWSKSQTGPWTPWTAASAAPTEAGTYYLKASVPADPDGNWTAVEAQSRFCVWTHPSDVFTDFVDIDLTGRPANVTNVEIRLREPVVEAGAVTAGLPGFEYVRTGEPRANEIRFVLTNAVKLADRLLPFRVVSWQPGGESVLVVKVPVQTGSVKSIRMYWHAQGGDPKSDNYEEDVSATADAFAGGKYGLVCREGTWIDYWTAVPSLTKTIWDSGETLPTNADVQPGELKKGSVEWFVLTMPRATTNALETIQTAAGTYVTVFRRKSASDGATYSLFGGEKTVQYEIIWHNTYEDLGGTAGGRILLGNNDTMPGHEITGQAYWQTDPTTSTTYWSHDATGTASSFPYAGAGITHTLYLNTPGGVEALWRLEGMRLGSLYPRSGNPSNRRCYLPWSSTSQPSSAEDAEMSTKEVACMIFRDAPGAALYSPCYTNGIGVIYFDLVNGFDDDRETEVIVEVARKTARDDLPEGENWPTDENCANGDEPFFYLNHSLDGTELSDDDDMWEPATNLTVLIKKKNAGEFAVDPEQAKRNGGIVVPRISTGGGTNAFYRVLAHVNDAGHCRFRIRRTGIFGQSTAIETSNLVLLDNVIASPPAMSATLDAPGTSDADSGRTGKQTLGQAGALSKAFPAMTDEGVLGRAKITYTTVPGVAYDRQEFVASARFNYRWRYLNQSFGDWQAAYLDHTELAGEDGEIMLTAQPLDFPRTACDVEWYYDMTLHAPAYKYVDYSGCGLAKPIGDFSEEQTSVEKHMPPKPGVRLASGGTDWFVRLREGRSEWEGMKVVITSDDVRAQELVREYPMELVGDNMWRAMVLVPTNAEGTCRFSFRGSNRHEGDDPDRVTVGDEVFGAREVPVGGAPVEIPNTGMLDVGGTRAVPFVIDHAAGYLEFRMSDRFLTYQVGRAEYQDFNFWNDAHKTHFVADSVDSNSVDVAAMNRYSAPFGTWAAFDPANTNWVESFLQDDYAPEKGNDFDKEIPHQYHETPNQNGAWSAQNITFVSERLASAAPLGDKGQKKYSGMAGKLLGSGKGKIDFVGTEKYPPPDGLEKVELRARIGQSYAFDAMTYNKPSHSKDNYMFFAPVTMSHRTKDDDTQDVADMAVGASASLIGYHSTETGCYEFRVERLYKNLDGSDKPTVRLSIHKWYVDGFQWDEKCLCWRDFDDVKLWSWEQFDGEWKNEGECRFYGMFISLETDYRNGDPLDPVSTRIVCGLSDAHKTRADAPWEPFANTNMMMSASAYYAGLDFTDDGADGVAPYGWGSYGVCSKDCPAQFVMPAHTDKPLDAGQFYTADLKDNAAAGAAGKEGGDGHGKYFKDLRLRLLRPEQEFVDDRGELHNRRHWATIPGRCECYTNTIASMGAANRWIGLRTPTGLTQGIDLFLRKPGSGESQWKRVGSREVSGYGFKALPAFDLKRADGWDVRLQTATNMAIDVVVDDVVMSRWSAPDCNDPNTVRSEVREDLFIFSQALVTSNAAAKAHWLKLQPARAKAERPVSLRSRVTGGLGKFTFSYCNADEHAEIWLQVATNKVDEGTLSGQTGYNESIRSKELGEQQEIGEWLTVAKYSCNAADPNYRLLTGTQTHAATPVYLGWHNHPDRPLHGIFRLFVPPHVVAAANVAATNATKNADWGSITVTEALCTDEPGVSERSWRGWNLRTIGDATDSERRMNLVDMLIDNGDIGLVGALNNSWDNVRNKKGEVVDGREPKDRDAHPAIYSPTMKPTDVRRGVGTVALKARLYAQNGVPTTSGKGQIVVWGATDSRATQWDVLCTNVVTSSVFSNFTWTAAGGKVYKAVKFEVTGSAAAGGAATVDRVVIDEIVIGEKVPPTVSFAYARPFRMNLFTKEPIDDIDSPLEQPLAGESWGVQTKLTLRQLTDEIDAERGFEVLLSYYKGEEPWGYEQWKDLARAAGTDGIELLQVGEPSNLVYRSYGETPKSLVSPSEGGETVQFMLTVRYAEKGGGSDTVTLTEWSEPDWFYPLAKNAEHGGDVDPNRFSAYTVLDSVSPGRAWINEVNWNDGPMAENGNKSSVTNQFVEICVPAGVDMTGWKLRVTDPSLNQKVIAMLGDEANGIPALKDPTANCTNGYEFLVLKSPKSTVPQADASWYKVDIGTDISGGTLPYNDPLQLELIRPSGIIEHQFVMDGTNEYSKWSWGAEYDGTNLIRKLAQEDLVTPPQLRASPKRFWALRDLSRTTDASTGARVLSSTGVARGEAGPDTANWPGGANTWKEGMTFTPGRLNVGQTIPENWYILPNGTNAWVFFTLGDGRIRQSVAGDTAPTIRVMVPQGESTNVTYTVDNWYEAVIRETGRPEPTVVDRRTFSYTVTPTGLVTVTATTRPQSLLADRFGLKADDPYTESVLRWLREEYPEANAEDIRLARFKGLHAQDGFSWMSLKDMYWLDIPPVPKTPEERATNDGTNWWFRGGIAKFAADDHVITRQEGGQSVTYVNKQIEATLYASNACTHEAWAPKMLRGLDYTRSDDYTGRWTSVTFKVSGKLDLSAATEFMPFRTFTFNSGSFTGPVPKPGDPVDKPFTAVIDILDPFKSPIGRNYGWDKHPGTSANFRWRINADVYPYSIEPLKADSTYSGD